MSVHNGQLEVTKKLLLHGADLNAQTTEEDHEVIPLHEAVMTYQESIAALLLESENINPNLKNSNGDTPLGLAVRAGNGFEGFVKLICSCKNTLPIRDKKDPNDMDALITIAKTNEVKNVLKTLAKKNRA